LTTGILDIAVIGARPYGLSLAADLCNGRQSERIFGSPMNSWSDHMPRGMHLKSEGCASSLYDSKAELTLRSYEDLGRFILHTPSCIPAEADRLLRRILASLLVGNTDADFKNFAMFHARDGLRLTRAYDLVATSFHPQYQSIALSVAGVNNMAIGSVQAKHLLRMAQDFGVAEDALVSAVEQLGKRLPTA
jgi:serine/threonine protein kinase HipA of HipAB toxin-antitoxin module